MPRVAKSSNACVEKFGGSDAHVLMVNAPAAASPGWPSDTSPEATATITRRVRCCLPISPLSGTAVLHSCGVAFIDRCTKSRAARFLPPDQSPKPAEPIRAYEPRMGGSLAPEVDDSA